jgi:N-acetylglucosamine-6-sulfatase
MAAGRSHRAGFALAVASLALLAWAASVALGSPVSPSATVTATPVANASAERCDAKCQSARDQHRQNTAALRRKNAQQKRPNVVVIDTDDMNQSDIWVMQKTLALLGAKGTTFENSYVSYPLCCPSRATFLTGQYAHNHHVLTDQRFIDLDSTNTLSVWLRRAKYRTAMVGKYLNGYGVINRREIPPGWSQWYALTGGTEQKRYSFNLNENGKLRYYPRKASSYIDYVLDSKVNGLLKMWAPSPKPFFLYYNPNNPHGERALPTWSTRDPEPAPQYLGHFGDPPAPRPPNFNVVKPDQPREIRDLPPLTDDQLADLDRRYRGRIESLLSVDDEVKRIVGLVRKYGDKRKTFYFFTSDNGLEMGSHRIEFKEYLYEEGERVPLIIRGPGIPEGVTRPQPVANVDLAPTIVSITGAIPGRIMDGIPLQPLTRDPTRELGRDLLFESPDTGSYGVRRGHWAYNEYPSGDAELYDLTADPYELDNLADDHANAALVSSLHEELAQLRACSGASCHPG